MKTALCDLLGIDYPIIAAPMGPDLTGPEFVAAVSNAGGYIAQKNHGAGVHEALVHFTDDR